jgi:hypothetical protein
MVFFIYPIYIYIIIIIIIINDLQLQRCSVKNKLIRSVKEEHLVQMVHS